MLLNKLDLAEGRTTSLTTGRATYYSAERSRSHSYDHSLSILTDNEPALLNVHRRRPARAGALVGVGGGGRDLRTDRCAGTLNNKQMDVINVRHNNTQLRSASLF